MGPRYNTDIQTMSSGQEARNQNWLRPRDEMDAGYGIAKIEDLELVLDFFHVSAGQAYGFRVKNWLDYKSGSALDTPADTDQLLGAGGQTEYQLIKTYTVGVESQYRVIRKPVGTWDNSTVLVAVDGGNPQTEVETAPGADQYTIDYTTGIITFGVAPTGDVTAGFEYDLPMRFQIDALPVSLDTFYAGNTNIPLIELRDP